MTPDAARRAAGLLLAARRERRPIAGMPKDCAPADIAEGYEIQAAVLAALRAEDPGAAIVGFKIGATSAAAQEFLSLDGPFYGCIAGGRVLASPAQLSFGAHTFCLIEPEFALRLGRDLPAGGGPLRRDDAAAAVVSVYPAFEVVASAYGEAWRTAGAPALIADNGVHACLVLGPEREDWRDFDLAEHGVSFQRNGREEGSGRGANALGHPLDALAWLAAQGVAGGRGLKAGDIVSTGVVTPFLLAAPGDDLIADFGALGQVRLQVTP